MNKRASIIVVIDYLIINILLLILSDSQITYDLFFYLISSALWLIFSYIFGLNTLANIRNIGHNLRNTLLASLIVGSLFIVLTSLKVPYPNWNLYLITATTVASLIVWRVLCYEILNSFQFTDRIAIVGLNDFSKLFVNSLLEANAQDELYGQTLGRKIICIFDNECSDRAFKDVKIVEQIASLEKYVRRLKINTLIISSSKYERVDGILYKQYKGLQQRGVSIINMPNVYEKMYQRVPIQYVDNTYFVSLNMLRHKQHYEFLKLLVDLGFGFVGCLSLIAFIPVVWVLNFFGNQGPLFYTQERIGKDEKTFKILKFRTMIVNAESKGPKWSKKNDPRITKSGRILRRLRIDEIPQFVNLLKGDMSLIGPRPERPVFVTQLNEEIPFYTLRHQVKPGISGWAQVMYRYTNSTEGTKIKLEYDLYYIKNHSLLLDFRTILKTIKVVLHMQGQ